MTRRQTIFYVLLSAAFPTQACDLSIYRYVLDPKEQVIDRTPPTPPQIELVRIVRDVPRRPSLDDVQSVTLCGGGVGQAQIKVTGSTDDRTPESNLGYRIRVVEGKAPEGSSLTWDWAQQPHLGNNMLAQFWLETEEQKKLPINVWLEISAVDKAGNESRPSNRILLHAAPSDG